MNREGSIRWAAGAACVVVALLSGDDIGATAARGQDFVLSEEQFNAWVTNGQDSAVQRIDNQFALQLRSLKRTCDLTPDQVEKLRLAARGDVERYQARITEVHDRLVGKTYNQNEINNLWRQIQPLQQELPRVLGPQSLFHKVLRRTLRQSQRIEYERGQAERGQYRYAAKVRLFVASFDRAAPMDGEQREALLGLILAETRRPQRFSEYDVFYVQVHAARIPDAKYAEVLDAAQVRTLRRVFQQARAYEALLTREGIEPVDEAEPPAIDVAEGAPAINPAEANGR